MQIEEETFFGAVLTHSSPIYISDHICAGEYTVMMTMIMMMMRIWVYALVHCIIYIEREKKRDVYVYTNTHNNKNNSKIFKRFFCAHARSLDTKKRGQVDVDVYCCWCCCARAYSPKNRDPQHKGWMCARRTRAQYPLHHPLLSSRGSYVTVHGWVAWQVFFFFFKKSDNINARIGEYRN